MKQYYIDLIKNSDPVNAEIIQGLLNEIKELKSQIKSYQENCDHSDMEEGQCLLCGADRTEELSALAYDRYKDRMKYGDD